MKRLLIGASPFGSRLKPLFFTCVTALSLLFGSASATDPKEPVSYDFKAIADTSGDFVGFDSIVLNDRGTVAFYGRFAEKNPGVFAGDGEGPLTTVFPDTSYGDLSIEAAINDRGTIAFNAGGFEARGLLTYKRGKLSTVYNDPAALTQFLALNNKGSVAFLRYPSAAWTREEPTVLLASGGQIKQIGSGRVSGISLNDKETAIYSLLVGEQFSRLMSSHEGKPATVLVDAENSVFRTFYNPVISNRGTISFSAVLDNEVQGVYKLADGKLTTIADSTGPYDKIYSSTMNNRDATAFSAFLDSGQYGIYTGPDPIADKVIEVGDRLLDSTVTEFSFGTQGLNDRGELAFVATLADGRRVIALASPVSEAEACCDTRRSARERSSESDDRGDGSYGDKHERGERGRSRAH